MARTVQEVEQSEIATLVVESNLTDTNESARAAATVGAHARQVVTIEQRITELQRAFGFGGSGTDLDERCAQMPGFPPRAGSSPAQGAILTLTRDDSSGELTVGAGASFSTAAGVVYVLAADVTFLDGSLVYPFGDTQPLAYVICTQPGATGNCDAGAIKTVRSAPAGVIACNNSEPLLNGLNRELDPALRKRAFDWFAAGLTLLTPKGLLALARSYRATDGTRIVNPTIWVDPARPYAEIVIPPMGAVRPALTTTGIVPDNGALDFYFDSPRVGAEVLLYVNDVGVTPVQWVTLAERGRAYLTDDADFWSPGDTWRVSGGQCYIGWIADFQRVIEGMLAFVGTDSGFRATATRVRAIEATPESISFAANIVYASGFDANQVNVAFRSGVIQYVEGLAPGEPVVYAHLSARMDRLPGVQDHQFLNVGDPTLALPLAVWPASARVSLVCNTSGITINGSI